MQRFVAFLQCPHGVLLGFVLDEAILFNGVLPRAKGGVDSHARQYATASKERTSRRRFSVANKSVLTI
jgi:hypothetical protein